MSDKKCPAKRTKTGPVNGLRGGRQQQQPRRRLAQQRASSRADSTTESTESDGDEEAVSTSSPTDSQLNHGNNNGNSLKEKEIHYKENTKQANQPEDKEKSDAMQPRLDWKLALLYTLLVLQVLIVMIYVTSTPHIADLNAPAIRDTVSFVDLEPQQAYNENKTKEFRLITGETSLRDIKTFKLFQAYNRTLCWRGGVDDRQMRRFPDSDNDVFVDEERCACNQGWHGSDCGQPEVVWRAIMASKQVIKLKRRKLARRIVHTFYVHDHDSAIAEVIVEELHPVVDLFVVGDFSGAEDNFRHKLAKGFLAKQQDKILYVNLSLKAKRPARIISKYIWEQVKKTVKNIRDDDVYVTTDSEQILNGRALMFLKIYDGWPQPIGFRSRWSVFGFFWQHPQKTTITINACTVGLMKEGHRFNSMVLEKEIKNGDLAARDSAWIIGDLNHYGGWYCQYCQGPANIIASLREKNHTFVNGERNIDVPFVEDLIGTGTWFDEKTSLIRAHRSSESYYAPETVVNNTWKYDWLVENFYAKLDYY